LGVERGKGKGRLTGWLRVWIGAEEWENKREFNQAMKKGGCERDILSVLVGRFLGKKKCWRADRGRGQQRRFYAKEDGECIGGKDYALYVVTESERVRGHVGVGGKKTNYDVSEEKGGLLRRGGDSLRGARVRVAILCKEKRQDHSGYGERRKKAREPTYGFVWGEEGQHWDRGEVWGECSDGRVPGENGEGFEEVLEKCP